MSVLPKVLAHEAHLYVFLAMRAAAFESFFGAQRPLARRNAETMKPRFLAAVHRPPQCSFAGALDAINRLLVLQRTTLLLLCPRLLSQLFPALH